MKVQVAKWGNSLGVRLSKAAVEALGIEAGSSLEMELRDTGVLLKRPEPDLDALVAAITPDNLHGEIADGGPQGSEAW